MALYSPYSHHRSDTFEDINFDDDPKRRILSNMDTVSDDSSSDRVNYFLVFVFILDLLVLIFVAVLEFFLRFTTVFPVRHVMFSCTDESISYKTTTETYRDFAYDANISSDVIVALVFCIPPFVIIIGELALWAFSDEEQKNVRILCHECKMPQVVRRIFRYIGTFLYGLLVTMIFVDVTKIMVGRLRPTFLETCDPDPVLCDNVTIPMNDERICRTYSSGVDADNTSLREARLSFPSFQAAITAFAALYLAIYLHSTIRAHSVRIMRPFICLSFAMMALLCALSRYGKHANHWEDVFVGVLVGMVFAIYVGVFVLNNFREYLSSKKLYLRLRNFFAEQRAMELRDLYKEVGGFPGGFHPSSTWSQGLRNTPSNLDLYNLSPGIRHF